MRADALRADLARRERVVDLDEQGVGEEGRRGEVHAVRKFVLELEQLLVPQLHAVEARGGIRVGGLCVFLGVGGRVGVVHVVTVTLVHLHAALLRRAVDAVGDEELVQQARVVGVAQVLGVELPVAGDQLPRIAENADRAVEEALDHPGAELAEILLQRLGALRLEGAEKHAFVVPHGQFSRRLLLEIEVVGHAAFALEPLAEGQAGELAGGGIAPAVIEAHVALGVPAQLAHDHRAAVRAAVDEGVDRAVLVARHHDRRVADPRGAEVAGVRDLGFQTQIAPGRAAEDALHLERVQLLVVVQAKGDARIIVARPAHLCSHIYSTFTLSCLTIVPQ